MSTGIISGAGRIAVAPGSLGAKPTGYRTVSFVQVPKNYTDPVNSQNGFAALLVCSEADEACPAVRAAAVRISIPYLDPKIYDDSPFEAVKYAERRDDVGRLMLASFLQTRNNIMAK